MPLLFAPATFRSCRKHCQRPESGCHSGYAPSLPAKVCSTLRNLPPAVYSENLALVVGPPIGGDPVEVARQCRGAADRPASSYRPGTEIEIVQHLVLAVRTIFPDGAAAAIAIDAAPAAVGRAVDIPGLVDSPAAIWGTRFIVFRCRRSGRSSPVHIRAKHLNERAEAVSTADIGERTWMSPASSKVHADQRIATRRREAPAKSCITAKPGFAEAAEAKTANATAEPSSASVETKQGTIRKHRVELP